MGLMLCRGVTGFTLSSATVAAEKAWKLDRLLLHTASFQKDVHYISLHFAACISGQDASVDLLHIIYCIHICFCE